MTRSITMHLTKEELKGILTEYFKEELKEEEVIAERKENSRKKENKDKKKVEQISIFEGFDDDDDN